MREQSWRRHRPSAFPSSTRPNCCVAWRRTLNLASVMTLPAHTTSELSALTIGRAALRQLHQSLLSRAPDQAIAILQETGYASGEGVYRSLCDWLPGHAGVEKPED